MSRAPNLRQIEAFKALIELGTVTKAAEYLSISQPAVSKLLIHLENDTELKLFERYKGRLTPTAHAMQLYDSVKKLFLGMNKLDAEIDLIRRGKQYSLTLGCLPALSGPVMAQFCADFIRENTGIQMATMSRSSGLLSSWLVNHQVDIAFVQEPVQGGNIRSLSIFEMPLVCILPLDHALSKKQEIYAKDLENVDFIDFNLNSNSSKLQQSLFIDLGITPKISLSVTTSPFMAEFVAQGLGIALVHPMSLKGRDLNIAIRPFLPELIVGYSMCWSENNINQKLIEKFVRHIEHQENGD